MYGSLDFSNRLSTVLTDLSAMPLLWGKCELLVMCLNQYTSCVSQQAYCRPLLLTRVAWTPCLEKMAFSARVTCLGLIEDNF